MSSSALDNCKLTYFPLPGRGETSRLLLAIGGVELAVSVRDMERRDGVVVLVIGAGVVIQIGTGAGFVAALAAAKAFELRGRLR